MALLNCINPSGGGSLPSIDCRAYGDSSTRVSRVCTAFVLPSHRYMPQDAPAQLDATSAALRCGRVSSACVSTVYRGITPRRPGSGRTWQHEQPFNNLSYQLSGMHTREKRKAAA